MSAPAPDPDPNFKAKQKNGAPPTYRGNGSTDSEMGSSGPLPRTGSDTNTEDGASRLNNRDGNVGFQSPRNAGNAEGDDADSGSKTGTGTQKKKSPGVPRAKDDEEGNDGARRAPTIISVDEKVAWRAAPVRTRVGAKTQTASARLVRLPAYPKSEWLPVDGDSKVAKN
jgi:hypothetical protein